MFRYASVVPYRGRGTKFKEIISVSQSEILMYSPHIQYILRFKWYLNLCICQYTAHDIVNHLLQMEADMCCSTQMPRATPATSLQSEDVQNCCTSEEVFKEMSCV